MTRSPAPYPSGRIVNGVVARMVCSPDELALPLPPGLTVVPAPDPDDFARALAARTGGQLVTSAEEAAAAIARRRAAVDVPELRAAAEEVAWLGSLLEGGATSLPPRLLIHPVRAPVLQALGNRVAEARRVLGQARVDLLKREGAVQAEARRTPGALADVEPELARRVAHRVDVALRRARAAKRALGPKPDLDRETEQLARRSMSRLEDASFAHAQARSRVHARLAVGNVVGLLLALLGGVLVWSGADLDAPSAYAVFALSGLSPLTALAIGAAGTVHGKRRIVAAHAACAEAFRRTGVQNADELAHRRSELEEWLGRADATAAARDAWREALQAWQAMAGPDVDPADVEELLAAGGQVRVARQEAVAARAVAEDALTAVAEAEAAVQAHLDGLLDGRPPVDLTGDGASDERPIVLAGSDTDLARIEQLRPPVPVALVTTAVEESPAVALVPPVVALAPPVEDVLSATEPPPIEDAAALAPTFVLDPLAARRLVRRARRLR